MMILKIILAVSVVLNVLLLITVSSQSTKLKIIEQIVGKMHADLCGDTDGQESED